MEEAGRTVKRKALETFTSRSIQKVALGEHHTTTSRHFLLLAVQKITSARRFPLRDVIVVGTKCDPAHHSQSHRDASHVLQPKALLQYQ
jgi:hypothetical protein